MTRWRIGILGVLTLLAACSKTAHVNVGGKELCFPSRFVPTPNAYISIVTRGLPKSDETLIYVPAKEVQEAIPGYVLSHSNQYTSAVMHDLRMVVSSTQLDFSHLEKEAWEVRLRGEKHYIEPDPRGRYTRIYLHFDAPAYMWQMALSPPPESGEGAPREGWYVGPCLEEPGSYNCTLLGRAAGLSITFNVDQANLDLRKEVVAYVEGNIQRWTSACGA